MVFSVYLSGCRTGEGFKTQKWFYDTGTNIGTNSVLGLWCAHDLNSFLFFSESTKMRNK